MNADGLWSATTNTQTGKQFEQVLEHLKTAHNGSTDIRRLCSGEYGAQMARLLQLRFRYEKEPMGAETLKYYQSIGLRKEMHEADDYYTRWIILTPLELYQEGNTKKYPLVFMNHGGGNAIETDEFTTGLHETAAREKFMLCLLQNTNWQNTQRVLDLIARNYPLDEERVYLTGYSQGGYQVTSTIFRIPERFAAAAPCGNDIYRDYDNFNIPYTSAETSRLKKVFLPIMQVNGVCEASSFVPVNDWKPRKDWGINVPFETCIQPGRDDSRDPTRIQNGRRPFSDMPVPPAGADKHEWMISRLNKRMDTLGCAPRDPKACISYLNFPEDELHHILGFYGDEEHIETHYGVKYYTLNIFNHAGINAFRYVAVENAPHQPPVLMGRLVWDFFKQFYRDKTTGQVVQVVVPPWD